jgi:hypothetical protein
MKYPNSNKDRLSHGVTEEKGKASVELLVGGRRAEEKQTGCVLGRRERDGKAGRELKAWKHKVTWPVKSRAAACGLSFAFCVCNPLARVCKVRPLCSGGSAFAQESAGSGQLLPARCPLCHLEIPATH